MRALLTIRAARPFVALALVLVLGTVVGVVVLRPDGSSPARDSLPGDLRTREAEVTTLAAIACRVPNQRDCRLVRIRLLDGPEQGRVASFRTGETRADPDLSIGDRLRVVRNPPPPPGTPPEARGDAYSFADLDRRSPMLWLTIAFAAIVVVFGRVRGALSLAGLAASLVVVGAFIVPAILDGRPPLAVAVVGSLAVMLLTIALAHGLGLKSLAAILGTAASLALTVTLAVTFTNLTDITGLSSEEAVLLQVGQSDLSLEGLVLAGMVIGALGVLDDVTVSQASAVMALRRANPAQRFGELYRGALTVGRDHVAATVNTLVLAYVGTSLPILLIFSVGETPFADAVSKEAVAEQIVAALVGSIGLISAVPITTALAALLAARLPPEQIDVEPVHAH